MIAAAICDIGKIRKINQDNIYVSTESNGQLQNLFIVADGMGGHNAGELASKIAIETLVEFANTNEYESIDALLKNGIEATNKKIFELSQENIEYQGMGTTLLVATIKEKVIHIANVGDSRLYILHKKLSKITVDHSLVEEMLLSGRITKQEAKSHPKKNIITRAVGVEGEVEVDVFSIPISDATHVLMCSDGLTNMLDEKEITHIMEENIKDVDKTVNILVNKANKKGGYDNISVIIVKLT